MITDANLGNDPLQRDRILIVADPSRRSALTESLRNRYPDWDIAHCDTYLASIAEVSHRSPRVVLAHIDAGVNRLEDEPGFWETHGYHLRGDPWKEERYAGD